MKRLWIPIASVILVAICLILCSPWGSNIPCSGYGYGYYETRIYQLENAHELDMQKIQDLNDALNEVEPKIAKMQQTIDFLQRIITGDTIITSDSWEELWRDCMDPVPIY